MTTNNAPGLYLDSGEFVPAAELRSQTVQPAEGAAYAELPTPHGKLAGEPFHYTADQMRDFADRTHALRASHGQAAAAPKLEELLVWAVEDGLMRMSDVFKLDLQDSLERFARRFAAPTAQPAPAPTPQADSRPALGQLQQLEAYYALLDAMGWESKREHVSPETWAADLLRDATAYRAAHTPADSVTAPAAGAVAGWKLVPVKPTPEMVHAVRFAGDPDAPPIGAKVVAGETAFPFVSELVAERMCRAMLAAAPTPAAQQPNIEAAAKVLARRMDYPWELMPEQGRGEMRKHAKAILEAAGAGQRGGL